MSIKIGLAFFMLIIYAKASAQLKEDRITHIKQIFYAINNDHGLKRKIIHNDELAKIAPDTPAYDGGEEIAGYYKNDTLVKITYSIGMSLCNKTFEFYFENSKVLFVYEKQAEL